MKNKIVGCGVLDAPKNKKETVGQGLAPAVKKIASLLLAITMLFSITAGIDLSAYAATSGDYEYEVLDDGTIEIIKYNGSDSIVSIPSTINGKEVTSIGEMAFSDCYTLTSITIPDSIINIGYGAFSSCSSLISITIPNSVTSIGNLAFIACESLEKITVDSNNKYYSSENGVLYNKSKTELIQYPCRKAGTSFTIPNNVTSIGEGAFALCKNLTNVTISNGVISIDHGAFYDCKSLTSVTIGSGVTNIGEGAFYECKSLTNVTIGKGVTSIGNEAFDDCIALTDVYYDGTKVEWYAIFIGSENEDLTDSIIHCKDGSINQEYMCNILDDGTIEIEEYNGLDSIVSIPGSIYGKIVTIISEEAFAGCASLTSVTIPNSVTSIGDGAFAACESLEKITVDSNNRYYSSENGVLYNKSKTELVQYPVGNTSASFTISNSVASIGFGGFYGCRNLTTVIIPNSVINIGYGAFFGCESLTSVTIGNGVTSIGDYAFSNCMGLTNVYYDGTKNEWNKICIGDFNTDLTDAIINCTDGVLNERCENHSWDNGKVTNVATCKATGVKTYICTICGETKTETIAKTSHTYKTTTTKATTSKNGSVVTKCSVCGDKKSSTTIYYPKTISLSATSYTYDGKVKKPTVTVKDSKGKKIAASNYTVTYASGRKNVGTYTVTIKFKGNYSGTVKKTFTIKPKVTTLSSVTAGKKKFTAKWKKQATQTTGYQIQYSTDKNFKKNNKTVTVSKNKTTSKTVSSLKAKKKYYVRIRTYKTVKVNGKSTKIYSSWSKSKVVTTKK